MSLTGYEGQHLDKTLEDEATRQHRKSMQISGFKKSQISLTLAQLPGLLPSVRPGETQLGQSLCILHEFLPCDHANQYYRPVMFDQANT